MREKRGWKMKRIEEMQIGHFSNKYLGKIQKHWKGSFAVVISSTAGLSTGLFFYKAEVPVALVLIVLREID